MHFRIDDNTHSYWPEQYTRPIRFLIGQSMKVGERVNAVMRSREWSEGELARRASIPQPTVHRIVCGESKSPRQENIQAIARAFSCSAEWLWTGIGKAPAGFEAGPEPAMQIGQSASDFVRAMLATKAGKALSKEARERLLGAAEEQPVNTLPTAANDQAGSGEILIPQYDIRASMGHGQVAPDYAEIVRNVIVKESYLQENGITFTSPAHLAMITGWGQSMEGTINDKDPLIVDRGVNEFAGDGIYVLTWNDHLYIKRLQMVDKETIELISDNPKHKDREVPLKDVTIHARVLLIWNAKKA